MVLGIQFHLRLHQMMPWHMLVVLILFHRLLMATRGTILTQACNITVCYEVPLLTVFSWLHWRLWQRSSCRCHCAEFIGYARYRYFRR